MNHKTTFNHKKIGIWGFGVVGQSAAQWLQQFDCSVQILDKIQQNHPASIVQTEESIEYFLTHNDIIIASPGISIHQYKRYHHKFMCELDIFAQEFYGITVAITGSVGKTSITTAMQHCIPQSIAAGNIGYPMLSALLQNPQPKTIILELSSFQLLHSKTFAPDIAIITNFYANHLDYHKNEEEYFLAKCNIFKYQQSHQKAIIPCSLIKRIENSMSIQSQIFLTCTQNCAHHDYPTFFIQNNVIKFNNTPIVENIDRFPHFTYQENWLQIIATLYLQNISLQNIHETLQSLPGQEHRLEKIITYQGSTFYNDSKSTVWQATKAALTTFDNQSCALFLGGLSKGADRTPLIQFLQNKPITVFAFGKEAQQIQNLCNQYTISCSTYQNLQDAVQACLNQPLPQNIILSPAGSSYDLFKNYQERGTIFKNLIKTAFQNH